MCTLLQNGPLGTRSTARQVRLLFCRGSSPGERWVFCVLCIVRRRSICQCHQYLHRHSIGREADFAERLSEILRYPSGSAGVCSISRLSVYGKCIDRDNFAYRDTSIGCLYCSGYLAGRKNVIHSAVSGRFSLFSLSFVPGLGCILVDICLTIESKIAHHAGPSQASLVSIFCRDVMWQSITSVP